MPEKDPSKIELVQQLLESAEGNVKSAKQLLNELAGGPTSSLREKAKEVGSTDGRIVEGVFDGQNMVGPDVKKYPVPANYASKSKLVEGDVLKLTILDDGSFIYKQIGPVERKKVVGMLATDGEDYRVLAGDISYKVLYASVTYFKGKPGDQVTLIIPDGREATWAAVENVLPVTAPGATPVAVEPPSAPQVPPPAPATAPAPVAPAVSAPAAAAAKPRAKKVAAVPAPVAEQPAIKELDI